MRVVLFLNLTSDDIVIEDSSVEATDSDSTGLLIMNIISLL